MSKGKTEIRKIRMQAKGTFQSGNVEAAKAISNLADAYEFLAAEYGRVMELAGFSESREAAEKDALEWIDATKRPSLGGEQRTVRQI